MVVLTSWGGAQYLDIWTFIHLLGGVALAYAIRIAFNINLLDSLIVVGVILVGWEVYEGIAKVAEPLTNSVSDLLAGFAGVWIAYQIPLFEEAVKNGALALSLLIVWGGLNVGGWIAWKQRHEQNEIRFLEERAAQKNIAEPRN